MKNLANSKETNEQILNESIGYKNKQKTIKIFK